MKKFNSNISTIGAGRRICSLLMAAVASLIFAGTAWAETQAIFSIAVHYQKSGEGSASDHNYNIARDNSSCTNPGNYPCNTDLTPWISNSTDLGTVISGHVYVKSYIWCDVKENRTNGFIRGWVDSENYSQHSFSYAAYYDNWCSANWHRYDASQYDINISSYSAGSHYFKFVARSPWYDDSHWFNNGCNSCYYALKFTINGFDPSTGEEMDFGRVRVGETSDITNEYTMYGSSTISSANITGTNRDRFSVVSRTSSSVTVRFSPNGTGDNTATLTLTDSNSKQYTCSLKGKGISSESTTVFISENPVVTNIKNVKLSGYLKYTGCPAVSITDYGFYYSTNAHLANFCTGATKVQADGSSALSAKGTFSKTGLQIVEAGTYYYKAYVVADGECVTSEETRSFTIEQIVPKVTLTCPANTKVNPYEWVEFSATGEDYVGNLIWTVTSEGAEGEMKVTVVSSTSETMKLKLPRPEGTEGTTFDGVTYTITVRAVNGDESAEDSCTITLTPETAEDC